MNIVTDLLDVDKLTFMRVARKGWPDLHIGLPESFGVAGFQLLLSDDQGPIGSVIVSQAEHDGTEWIHASMAFVHEMPAYEDLCVLKEAVFGGDREAYQVFATSARHISIHEYALHLWGRADGRRVLPDFGQHGTI